MATIAIGSDHAGVTLKAATIELLESLGHNVINCGTNNEDSVDYPDYAEKVANTLKEQQAEQGVLICGSGIGISIAANRFNHIRAALCHSEEDASLARQHNNANILVLGARTTTPDIAHAITHTFFTTQFEGGRHQRRIDKLTTLNQGKKGD